jgi:hypothetical protein
MRLTVGKDILADTTFRSERRGDTQPFEWRIGPSAPKPPR